MNNFLYEFFRATLLLLILLNPFLVILYLINIVQRLNFSQFFNVLLRGGIISIVVFIIFALLGDYVFNNILQAEFSSFQIFGGIIFLLIGIQFVFKGITAIEMLRGEHDELAGAIAMPIMIGPGTLSASVVIGKRLEPFYATLSIIAAVIISVLVMLFLKFVHDQVRSSNERLIQRYTEIAGRILALYVGTISIEMIMQGLKTWIIKILNT